MKYRIIFYFLWVVGLSVSAYLAFINYFGEMCPIGIECTTYPPILGLIWFAVTPVVIKRRDIRFVWQIAGLTGITVLVTLEILNNYFCPFCTTAHISGLIMIYLSGKFISKIGN